MYTVRIPIHTSEVDERYFAKCFFCAWEIRNSVTAYASRMLNALYADRTYRNAREEYGRKYSGLSADGHTFDSETGELLDDSTEQTDSNNLNITDDKESF